MLKVIISAHKHDHHQYVPRANTKCCVPILNGQDNIVTVTEISLIYEFGRVYNMCRICSMCVCASLCVCVCSHFPSYVVRLEKKFRVQLGWRFFKLTNTQWWWEGGKRFEKRCGKSTTDPSIARQRIFKMIVSPKLFRQHQLKYICKKGRIAFQTYQSLLFCTKIKNIYFCLYWCFWWVV